MGFKIHQKWKTFSVAALASLMGTFSANSVSLALPIMAHEFGATMNEVSWLSLVYLLIPSCALSLFGRMADLYGYKKQFIAGFIVFGLSSALLPLMSYSLYIVIFFRCIQSIGYALLISITMASCNRAFPPEERGMALGMNSVFVSVGLAAGPTVGGLLMTVGDWRFIFYANVPICILGVLLSVFMLKEDKPCDSVKKKMDFSGAAFFMVFISALSIAINNGAVWGATSVYFIGCIVLSIISFGLFIRRELRADVPLVELSLFKNRVFSLLNLANLLLFISQQMVVFLLPFFLMDVLSLSNSSAGLVMLASPVVMMVFSPLGGRLYDKFQSPKPSIFGLFIIAAGSIMVCRLDELTPIYYIVIALMLYGIGNSFCGAVVNSSIFAASPRENSGMVSGIIATLRTVGQSLSVAMSTMIVTFRQGVYAQSPGISRVSSQVLAQRDAFIFGVFVIALALVCIVIAGFTNKELRYVK